MHATEQEVDWTGPNGERVLIKKAMGSQMQVPKGTIMAYVGNSKECLLECLINDKTQEVLHLEGVIGNQIKTSSHLSKEEKFQEVKNFLVKAVRKMSEPIKDPDPSELVVDMHGNLRQQRAFNLEQELKEHKPRVPKT